MLRWLLLLASAAYCLSALAQSVEVPPELWDRPRTAQAVLGQDSVKRAVLLGLEKPEAQIAIHHGAGQEPLLQAEELRSWLAALGVDSRRIALRSDGVAGAPMRIEIIP